MVRATWKESRKTTSIATISPEGNPARAKRCIASRRAGDVARWLKSLEHLCGMGRAADTGRFDLVALIRDFVDKRLAVCTNGTLALKSFVPELPRPVTGDPAMIRNIVADLINDGFVVGGSGPDRVVVSSARARPGSKGPLKTPARELCPRMSSPRDQDSDGPNPRAAAGSDGQSRMPSRFVTRGPPRVGLPFEGTPRCSGLVDRPDLTAGLKTGNRGTSLTPDRMESTVKPDNQATICPPGTESRYFLRRMGKGRRGPAFCRSTEADGSAGRAILSGETDMVQAQIGTDSDHEDGGEGDDHGSHCGSPPRPISGPRPGERGVNVIWPAPVWNHPRLLPSHRRPWLPVPVPRCRGVPWPTACRHCPRTWRRRLPACRRSPGRYGPGSSP